MGYANPKNEGAHERIIDEECQRRASRAKVMMSYRVWKDAFEGSVTHRTALSFDRACELMREGERSSMQVLFRWRLGDKEGDGCVSYVREDHPTATNQFIERMTRKLIERVIAEDLATGRFIVADRDTSEFRRAASA